MDRTFAGETMADPDHGAAPPRAGEPPSGLHVELFEVAVFVLQILPSLVLSFFARGGGETAGEGRGSYALGVAALVARDLSLVSLIAFFAWRNGDRAAQLGWTARHLPREIGMGILLFVPVAASMAAIEILLHVLGIHGAPSLPVPAILRPEGPFELALATAMVAVVAVVEEVIFRGYLVLRLRRLSQSRAIAVLLSSVIFALGHGYEGAMGVITIGWLGLLLAVLRLWRGSLAAPIAIHFLQDLLSVVILPLVASRP
jgi:membrane protease YdiL (CAAX protease family)